MFSCQFYLDWPLQFRHYKGSQSDREAGLGMGSAQWGIDRTEPSTLKDLMVRRFKVSRYLERRNREGSAMVP